MTKEQVVEMVKKKVGELGNRKAPPTLDLQVEALAHVLCDLNEVPFSNIVGSDDDAGKGSGDQQDAGPATAQSKGETNDG
jgi:hypothetical protein